MASSGIRKAALLLMSLDPASAAELLRAAKPEVITQIAAELAYLEATGAAKAEAAEPVREFFRLLSQKGADSRKDKFVETMLEGALGAERSRNILSDVRQLLDDRDPFLPTMADSSFFDDQLKPYHEVFELLLRPSGVAKRSLNDLP